MRVAQDNTRSVGLLSPADRLSGELIDGIADAVATPRDPYARSVAITTLIGEICATIEWLHDFNPQHEEVASLRAVLAEAQQHQIRMIGLPGPVQE